MKSEISLNEKTSKRLRGGNIMRLERLSSKKGFTMVELVVVITILAIISVIGVQQVGTIMNKSRASADVSNAKVIADCLTRAIAEERLDTALGAISTAVAVPETTTYTTNVGTGLAGLLKGAGTFATSAANTGTFTANIGTPYLSGIPPVKRGAGSFMVTVSQTGSITVAVGIGAGAVQLYPRPVTFATGIYDILN